MNSLNAYVDNAKNYLNTHKAVKSWLSTVGIVVAAMVAMWVVMSCFIFCSVVQSGSMENTLFKGDYVIAPRVHPLSMVAPKRGDVVFFKWRSDPFHVYVKRIIGMPGDRVIISGNNVMVNDKVLKEPYVKGVMKPKGSSIWHVPAGKYFVLGDNRNNSADSRFATDVYVDFNNILACRGVDFSMKGVKLLE